MIIVTGSVQARPEHLAEVLALSLEHVHRSRAEPGCLLHSVHQDVEDPNRVVFLEHWSGLDALRAHFAVPASGAFVAGLTPLVAGAPTLVHLPPNLVPDRRRDLPFVDQAWGTPRPGRGGGQRPLPAARPGLRQVVLRCGSPSGRSPSCRRLGRLR
ncbi:MAG: putative quinol monooxygenase [Acidimicrobiales bacterium]